MGFSRKLLILLLVASTAWPADPDPGEARKLYRAAQQSEKRGDTLNAYLLYAKAAELAPGNVEYTYQRNVLQARAALNADVRLGDDPAAEPSWHPSPESEQDVEKLLAAGELSPAEISDLRDALPPPHLEDPGTRKSFDLVRADAQKVIDEVTRAYGIQAVYDPQYQAPPPFSFRVQSLSMNEALRSLEAAANSIIIPLGDHSAVVFRDTPQRRTESMPTMAVEIPIPERLTAQEAQEILTAVQQTLELRKVAVDPGRHMVYVRDQVTKVLAAKQLFDRLSRARTQVEVEVELLSVAKNSSLSYGLSIPDQSALVNFGSFLHNPGGVVAPFTKYLTFGGGASLFGLGVAQASAMASVNRSSATSTLKAAMVTLDGQPATLHLGDRYPIVTAGYYGPTNGTGQVYVPPPTIQFQDLGLELKVTPSVHQGGEVTLDLEAQYAVLGSVVTNDIPSISSRKFVGKVRLAEGEWAVIAGLAETDVGNTYSGPLGLSNVPLIGRLFRTNTVTKDSSEVLVIIKPHLTNLPPWEFPNQTLWIGTESTPLSVY